MFFILTTAGQALVDASPGVPIICTSYKLASSTPYTPVVSQTDMVGASLFTGVPAAPSVQTNGSIRYTITLDPTIGDFVFNEAGLYVDTTLFAVASNSTAITKLRTTGLVVGNSMVLECYVSPISGGNSFLDIANSSTEYNIAQLGLVDNLPAAVANDINIYQVGIAGSSGKSTLAFSILDKWDFADYSEIGTYTTTAGAANYVQFGSKKPRPEFDGHIIIQVLTGANIGQVRTVSNYVEAQNRYELLNSFNSTVDPGTSVQVLAYNKLSGTAIFGTGAPTNSTDTRFGRYIDDSITPNVEYVYSVASGTWSRLGIKELAEGIKRPKVCLVGDASAVNYRSRPTANTSNVNQDNIFTWFNALANDVFEVVGVYGSATATAAEVNSVFITQALSSDCDYVDLSVGGEDIYTVGANATAVRANLESIIDRIIDAGKIPIWTTVPARAFVSEAKLAEHLKLNYDLRELARNKAPSLFWDAFSVSVDYKENQCAALSEFTTNGTKLNNIGAYFLAKSKLSTLAKYIPSTAPRAGVLESFSRVGSNNILVNPGFAGTAGTLGANCVGSVPTGWRVQWATRTGTGVVRSTIVDVVDVATGIYNSSGVRLTLESGSTLSGDVVQLIQDTGLNININGGMYISAEANIRINSIAGVNSVELVATTNGNSAKWGSYANGLDPYTESADVRAKTLYTQVSGTGATASASVSMNVGVEGNSEFAVVFNAPVLKQIITYPYTNN